MKRNNLKRLRLSSLFLTVLLTFSLSWVPRPLLADVEVQIPDLPSPPVKYLTWPTFEEEKPELLVLVKSTSLILRFDRPIVRAAISDPEICDIRPLGEKEILLYAKEAGLVNLVVWDETYNITSYNIQATLNIQNLYQILYKIDPQAELRIVPFKDTVAVYGTTGTSEKLKRMTDTTLAFNEKAVNFLKIKDPKEILLEVRFAEVNRKASQNYGLDMEAVFSYWVLRSFTGETGMGSSSGTKDDFTTAFQPSHGFAGVKDFTGRGTPSTSNLSATYLAPGALINQHLKWLEQKNILKLIARPNLLTKDGQKASFIVGGETPTVVATSNAISVSYKEFGTKLEFTPEVLDDNLIRLSVLSSVSELDFSTTVSVQGTTYPNVLKRDHQTVAELHDNETLLIGGLMTQRISRIERKFPVLGDLPFLDKLFKKDTFERTDVELVVVITPHIVRPFRLNENKVFYEPEMVKETTQTFAPAYPDPQGDMIRKLIIQQELQRVFDEEWRHKKAVAMELEVKRIERKKEKEVRTVIQKEKSGRMSRELRKASNGKNYLEPLPFEPAKVI